MWMRVIHEAGNNPAYVETLEATDHRERYPDGTLIDSETITLEQYRAMSEAKPTV